MAATSAGNAVSTERLMHYWAEGAGAAKINWGVDGDFDRCRAELGKYVGPDMLNGLCANLHRRATGAMPGHAPGELAGKSGKGRKLPVGNSWPGAGRGRASLPGPDQLLYARRMGEK